MKKIILILLIAVKLFGQSYSYQLGNDIAINGKFSTSSDWTLGTGWSISGGQLVATSVFSGLCYQNILTAGIEYQVEFDVLSLSGDTFAMGFGNSVNISSPITTVGRHIITKKAVGGLIVFVAYNGTLLNATIDNITVRPVLSKSLIAKPKRNFIYNNQESDASLVFSYNGEKPINGILVDKSSYQNNGTLFGGVIYNGSANESGLQFNGRSSYVSVADANSLDFGTGDFSISTIALTSSATQQEVYADYDATTGDGVIFSIKNTGAIDAVIFSSNDTREVKTSTTFKDGKLHYIALIINRSSATGLKIYVDGIEQPYTTQENISTLAGVIASTSVKKIGTAWNVSSNYFNGQINSLNIYNRALSSQEIKEKYNRIARQIYYFDDLTDFAISSFPNSFNKLSGTFAIAQLTADASNLKKNDKYLNCTSSGSVYIPAATNISNYYMTYEYYTGGSWTSKSGTVSALSTAEATFDYSTTTGRLTFIMATNDRVAKIKIQKGTVVQ